MTKKSKKSSSDVSLPLGMAVENHDVVKERSKKTLVLFFML